LTAQLLTTTVTNCYNYYYYYWCDSWGYREIYQKVSQIPGST